VLGVRILREAVKKLWRSSGCGKVEDPPFCSHTCFGWRSRVLLRTLRMLHACRFRAKRSFFTKNARSATVYLAARLICSRIVFASLAGSLAPVMGLPTTMWLAPAFIASSGVTTLA
jgi:hypothetical protein